MSFILSNTHPSLAYLPHYTSGQTYFYPAFNAGRTEDAIKFAHEFGEVLAMPIMLEAVQRVRASRGQLSFTLILHLLHNPIVYQVYGWLLSMETFSLGPRTSSPCPPSHKTSPTQLKFKSKTISQRRLLSSRLLFFTQLATVSRPANFLMPYCTHLVDQASGGFALSILPYPPRVTSLRSMLPLIK